MEHLSVNTKQATQMPSMVSTAIKTQATVSRMDTTATEATVKEKNVDMPKLTQELNTTASKENLDISFAYNKNINRVVINVMDKNTGELITKLPSEDAVKFAEGMKEMLGKLFDRKG